MNIIQQLEQMQAFLRDLAPVLKSYEQNLIKSGFTEQQAFVLVREYQITLLQKR